MRSKKIFVAALLCVSMLLGSSVMTYAAKNAENGTDDSKTSEVVSGTDYDVSGESATDHCITDEASGKSDTGYGNADDMSGQSAEENTGEIDESAPGNGSADDVTSLAGDSDDSLIESLDSDKGTETEKYADAGIEEGYYIIHTAVDESYVLDIYGGYYASGTNVQLYKGNGSGAQIFKVTPLGNGIYTIINAKSGCSLDVYGGGTKAGTNVWQYKANGSEAQKWKIVKDSSENIKIFTCLGGGTLCLDLAGGITSNTRNIQIYTDNGTKAQNFVFEETEYDTSVSAGTYVIRTAVNGDKCLDIAGGSSADFANLQIYQYNGSNAQKFVLTDIGSGQYMISCVGSGKALDVYGGGRLTGQMSHSTPPMRRQPRNGSLRTRERADIT